MKKLKFLSFFLCFLWISQYGNATNELSPINDKPEKITILWDGSWSLNNKKLNRELNFLNDYFNHLKNVEVEVVSFAYQHVSRKTFKVKKTNWKELKEHLEKTVYDGATYFPNGIDKIESDEILLFSDGYFFNNKKDRKYKSPVYCIVSVEDYNDGVLNTLAVNSNGNIIDLNNDPHSKKLQLVKNADIRYLKSKKASKNKTIRISGMVCNFGKPLNKVNIVNKSTGTGTVTTEKGIYQIKANVNDKLVFSHLGYEDIVVTVTPNSKALNLNMIQGREELNEVVITQDTISGTASSVDFGRSKRTAASVIHIRSEDFNPSAFFLADAINGRGSGIFVDGFGQNARIFLRNTLTRLGGSKRVQPLYVIDNTPITQYPDYLDPRLIEDVVIIKSLAGVARYGSIARGGVIKITTRNYATARKRIQREKDSMALLNKKLYQDDAVDYAEIPLSEPKYMETYHVESSLEKAYEKYLEDRFVYSSSHQYYINMFEYFIERGDREKAFKILSNIMEVHSGNTTALTTLAHIYESLGEQEKAYRVYKQLLVNDPTKFTTLYGLINHYKLKGEYKLAASVLEKFISETEIKDPGMYQFISHEATSLYHALQASEAFSSNLEPFIIDDKYDARIVVEWDNPDAQFSLQFVSPDKRFSTWKHDHVNSGERIDQEKANGFQMQDFYIEKDFAGTWLLNLKYFGNTGFNPTYFKVTVYRGFGTESETREESFFTVDQQNVNQTLKEIRVGQR
ncbi:hypothetical protein GWK08_10475 [Leptobacterium flavescens]|uniref:Uncharacterized protein n=1 Tax=Leptobacterium flavescens TaxID=472055 RepID=A0A6P0UTW6_9FLAO|nr:carboxypeptidase-like regulatory domain-containing protein [Leptobacterium flavescens]NER13866.1 hypothetical protein [Leptobacterium flavescens]